MKQLLEHDFGDYIFNPTNGTITMLGLPAFFEQEQILTVVNIATNTMIYCFADPTLTGTLAGNVLDVNYNTTAMNASDPLQIYLDIPEDKSIEASMNEAQTHLLLQRICDLLEPMATQDSANRQRVNIDIITAGPAIAAGVYERITDGTTMAGVKAASTAAAAGDGSLVVGLSPNSPVPNLPTWGGSGGGNIEWQMIDIARTAYDTLRNKLTFGN